MTTLPDTDTVHLSVSHSHDTDGDNVTWLFVWYIVLPGDALENVENVLMWNCEKFPESIVIAFLLSSRQILVDQLDIFFSPSRTKTLML